MLEILKSNQKQTENEGDIILEIMGPNWKRYEFFLASLFRAIPSSCRIGGLELNQEGEVLLH